MPSTDSSAACNAAVRAAAPQRSRRNLPARLLFAAASLVVLFAAAFDARTALAQKGPPTLPEEEFSKSYTLPYFFSGFAVLLIVVPLCLPSVRLWDAPKDEDD